jgi:uncharacterized membrane protein (DUF485 family)
MTGMSSFARAPEIETHTAFEPGRGDEAGADWGNPDFAAIRDSPEFVAVRRRLVRFVFPAAAGFFCWYLTYVLLAAYVPELMGHQLFGSVTVGLVLGLSQFVTTVVIMLRYTRFMRRTIDPQVAALRARAGAPRS